MPSRIADRRSDDAEAVRVWSLRCDGCEETRRAAFSGKGRSSIAQLDAPQDNGGCSSAPAGAGTKGYC